ncbi:Fc.00g027400.m01.CDS01 [Cosmosporella sp. VM-42]
MAKLRRSLSEVFRGKKAEPIPTTRLRPPPLPEIREDEVATFPVMNHDDFQFEENLQQAVMDSLRDRNKSLEQERNSATTRARHLEEQLGGKTDELQRIQRDLARVQHDNSRARQLEASRTRGLQETISNLSREKDNQLGEQTQQIAELQQNLKEYQVYCVKMQGAQQQLQEKADALEKENNSLLQSPDCAVAEIQQDRARLGKRVKALEAEISHERSVRGAGNRAYEDLQNRKAMTDQQNKELTEEVASLHQAMEVIKAESSRRMIEKLDELQQRHEAEKEEASHALGTDLTPRTILVQKMFCQAFQVTEAGGGQNAAMFLQSCSPALLANHMLDIRLQVPQVRRFAENVVTTELTLLVCDLCQRPKFAKKPNANSRIRVNEFTRPSASCCSKSICTECYLETVTNSLATEWWTNLGVKNWLKCPTPSCSQALSVSHREGLTNLLRQLGDKDLDNNIALYDRILTFRAALKKLEPSPSDEALSIACTLHTQLVSVGRMHSLFDSMFTNTEPDHTGRIPAFKPGKIRMISVDHNGGSIQVPLFMRFLRRRRTPTECAVCTDELFDVEFGSLEEWLDLCTGFHGDWMWEILQYPVKLRLECNHDIDFCTGCLQRHLETQLEQYGRSRCDQLACPSDGCSRRLTYDEVRLYAKPETFDEYDRYLNLNTLSRYPNFRWCLRAGCSSGQIYGDGEDDDPLDPHIHCEECAFEMCYNHSMPWHEGQTCEQYDSIRQHGDPEFQQTREWIAQNTKPCPSCRENIQKGEYCFHMTCSSCHFEFCWECLADWTLISPGGGRHNANAHGAGCPFRTNGLTPMQISGTNLQEALQRRR